MKIITETELSKLLEKVSPNGIHYQPGRIVQLLAKGPSRTGIVASRCSVANIADVVLRKINPKIMPMGFWVGCQRPPQIILNKFGQRAGDFIWQLNKVPKSANDGDDDDEIGSSAQDWVDQLKPTISSSE
jgi:hypothetical protein